jgi:hypothetical protein
MNLFDKIFRSNTTLIGYDTQNEQSVEKLISLFPNVILFENFSDKEVLEHFNSISHFRDYKLSSILNNNKVNFIVVDLNSIYFEEESKDTLRKFKDDSFSKAIYIKEFTQELQSQLYTLSNTDSQLTFKLILLTSLYATMTPMNVQVEFKGGMTLMYLADLVVKFLGDKLTVEKDRITSNKYVQNIKEELREISIKSLFNEITTTTSSN